MYNIMLIIRYFFCSDLGPKLVDGNILFTDTQILEHVASYICNEKCHLKFTQLIFAGFDSFVETLKSKNLVCSYNYDVANLLGGSCILTVRSIVVLYLYNT